MPTQIRLLPRQIADMAVIRDIEPQYLQDVFCRLEGLATPPLRPGDLHQHVTDALQGDSERAECLLRPLLALYPLTRQRDMTVKGVLQGLRYGIEAAEWSQTEFKRWETVEARFGELLQTAAIRTVAKAIDLTYEYANLFQEARIVTDIRPVFNDDDGDDMKIDGAVVSYTLRLDYDNKEGNHSLSVALDEIDVRALREQCERALQKARIANARMNDVAGISTIIAGEVTGESN